MENIVLGAEPRRARVFLDRRAQRRTASTSLTRVGLPSKRFGVPVARLSRAEQQLVEIAKALHRRSRVILMDEPTAPLGPRDTQSLIKLMQQLIKEGVAIIFVSHKLEELLEVSDRVQVLRDGRHVWTKPTAELNKDAIVEAMIGYTLATNERVAHDGGGEVVLKLEGVSQGGRLHDVSLEVREGEILGVGGLVGSGRSRLLRVLAGAERPDGGVITLRGERYAPRGPAAAIARGVGMIPSERKREGLYSTMDVEANITAVRPSSRWHMLRDRRNRAFATEWIDKLSISPARPKASVLSLSGGNQQKVLVARWLHADIDVLLVDEPGEGVDVQGKAEIYEIIRSGARDGKAVVIVSSETEELFQLADRVAVMRGGSIAGYVPRTASEAEFMRLATGTGATSDSRGETIP
jgi:ABC-type sugar transport system ATPase subunit